MIGWRLAGCALVLLAACGGDKAATVEAARGCESDGDCKPVERCVFGLCSPSCTTTDDCKNGSICLETGRGAACVRLQDNACVTSANCPALTRCIGGRCLTSCETGTGNQCLIGQQCENGACMLSDEPWSGGDASVDASIMSSSAERGRGDASVRDGGAGTGGATAAAGSCAGGSVRCDGNWVVRCEQDGQTRPEQTCAFACQEGACLGSCTPTVTRCDRQDRQRCDDKGDWQTVERCPSFCTPTACQEMCVEGARQCNGTMVTRCTDGQMVDATNCGFVCQDGECSGECVPGTRRCQDGAASSCGGDGIWTPPIHCSNACVDGVCVGVCTPGAQRCAGNTGYQICSELGQWGPNQSCGGLACLGGSCAGTCNPGAARCVNATATQTCQASGQWGSQVACNNQACVNGGCSGVCAPDTKRCDPGGSASVQNCTSQGVWGSGISCLPGVCRSGACATPDCSPGSRRCDPTDRAVYQTCTNDGLWGATHSCTAGMSCMGAGECSALICQSGLSPDWFSDPQAGGYMTLDDPRWGGVEPTQFASSMGSMDGGFIIVLDRAAKQLAVSVRVTKGSSEIPTSSDYVYFGATVNVAGSMVTARNIVIPLISMRDSEAGTPIPMFSTSAFTDTWHEDTTAWVQHVNGWRGSPNEKLSWAVNFRVDLPTLGVDTAKTFRVAVAAHVEGAADMSTPATLGMSTDKPTQWSAAMAIGTECVTPLVLQ